jgi:galactonate dehydratase
VERHAFDVVQPDANVMGLSEAWHSAALAGLRNKRCCPHNWQSTPTMVANGTLAAAIPNLLMLEIFVSGSDDGFP